jgi:hypothetical protein
MGVSPPKIPNAPTPPMMSAAFSQKNPAASVGAMGNLGGTFLTGAGVAKPPATAPKTLLGQ